MSIELVALMQREQHLHTVGFFGYLCVVFRSLFDDGGQVLASTVFQKDVENARIPVNVLVDVSYNVFVNVAVQQERICGGRTGSGKNNK